MRLDRLDIHALPGIDPGFTLEGFDPGVTLITGPNASGKSSLIRALELLLYPDARPGGAVHLRAQLTTAGGTITVERTGNTVHWQEGGAARMPPSLPDRSLFPCYTIALEDLLRIDDDLSGGTAESAIGRQLVRELAGGYDVAAVADHPPFRLKSNHARAEARQLYQALTTRRQAENEQAELRQREVDLAAQRAELDRARDAALEVQAVSAALEWLDARAGAIAQAARLKDYPDGMECLRGDETERLDEARRRRAALDEQRREADARRADAARRLDETGLEDSDLDDARLAEIRRRLDDLRQTDAALDNHETELVRAEVKRREVAETLGAVPEDPPDIRPGTVHRVEQGLREQRRVQADQAVVRAEHEALQARDARLRQQAGDEPLDHPERLQEARRELARWLASPAPVRWGWPTVLGALAGLTAAGAGVLAAEAGATAFAVAAGVAALLAFVAASLTRARDPGTVERSEARNRFEATGLRPPQDWTAWAVGGRLAALDQVVAAAGECVRIQERLDELERAAKRLATEREQAAIDLRQLARDVGFDPQQLDASLDSWIRLTKEYRDATRLCADIRAQRDARQRERDSLRKTVFDFLSAYAAAPALDAPDADDLADRLERLAQRLKARDAARADAQRADTDVARLEADIREADETLQRLFTDAGLDPGDEPELRQRLERLDDWRRERDALWEANKKVEDRANAPPLQGRQDLAARVEAGEEAELHRLRQSAQAQADEHDELLQEITRTQRDMDHAGRRRALEQARAEVAEAEAALRQRLDEALLGEAGRWLLDTVREEHEHTARPALLKRADEYLARLTRHRYRLEFEARGPRFLASDTSEGVRKGLDTLSAGTRVQLLLAVRLAFTSVAEQGREPLPLFLDEVLTNADPERFRAAVEAVEQIAADGRQVLYLTAQPLDADQWVRAAARQPSTVDLARVRGWSAALPDDRLTVPAPPAPPEPAGHTAESYARALDVPAIDPWAPSGGIHLFHLLRGDLERLHRLLQAGVTTVGAARFLMDVGGGDAVLSREEQRDLTARMDAADAWLAARRTGRPRPLSRAALPESPVTDNFLDDVAALNDRLGGDAAALLQALADGHVKHFRTRIREQLEAWAEEEGYLDRREPLDADSIRHRVLGALAPYTQDGTLTPADIQSLVAALEAAVIEVGSQHAMEDN